MHQQYHKLMWTNWSYQTEESGSITRDAAKMVEYTLFGNIKLGYTTRVGDAVYFTQWQDLVKDIVQTIKHPHTGLPEHCCFVNWISFTRIYSSFTGMVNGFNMDKVFTSEQAAPISEQLMNTESEYQ